MPNWCSNTVTFVNEPAMIDRVEAAVKNGSLFEEFVPIGEWDYDRAVETWGTKWDIGDWDIVDRAESTITVNFMTAWSPPLNVYDSMLDEGFEITAQYYEPGMAFVGEYSSGEDRYYEFATREQFDSLPSGLVEAWGLEWDED